MGMLSFHEKRVVYVFLEAYSLLAHLVTIGFGVWNSSHLGEPVVVTFDLSSVLDLEQPPGT